MKTPEAVSPSDPNPARRSGPRAAILRAQFSEWTMWAVCFLAILIGGTVLVFITFFILREALPAFGGEQTILDLLWNARWRPLATPPSFGILHAWVSTLLVTGVCLAIAIPFGYGIGIFIAEIAPDVVRNALQPCLDLLAGIPAVVYGFVGYVTIVPLFERLFGMATGESILAAALVLVAAVLPFVASTSAEAFRAVPHEMRESAMALGVTRWYTIRRVVVPHAAPGMFAGAALGLARAVGETLIVMMLAGNSREVPTSLLDRGQPITALIATELGEAGVGSPKYHSLFAAGFLLMGVIVAINGLIWVMKKKALRHRV